MKRLGSFLLALVVVLNLCTGLVFANTETSTVADKFFDIMYNQSLNGSYDGTFSMKTDQPLEFVDKMVAIESSDEEISTYDMFNPMDYKLFAESLASVDGTMKADYNISETFDKMQMYAKMTFNKPIVLNENLSLEANVGYEVYLDFDFTNMQNPVYKITMKTPMNPKYIYIDYSALLKQTMTQFADLAVSEDAVYSAMKSYIESTMKTLKESMKNNSTVTFANNTYTMKVDDKGFKNMMFDVIDAVTSSTELVKLMTVDVEETEEAVEEMKSAMAVVKEIANKFTILGTDGYTISYKVDNSGKPVEVTESVDISINIYDITNAVGNPPPQEYDSITRDDWNIDIVATTNLKYSNVGQAVTINYPVLTADNSFDLAKIMEKEMNEEYNNSYEKSWFSASYDGYRVERGGETYIPIRAFAKSCSIYNDENILYNEDTAIVTLIAPKNSYAKLPFETLSFYGNGNSIFVDGQEHWIGYPTFEVDGTIYIPLSALKFININIDEIETTHTYYTETKETTVRTYFSGYLMD